MPLSADKPAPAGQSLAVLAEALFLANLLVLPGVAFFGLLWLWRQRGAEAPPLARQHLWQALVVSLWGGVLIVLCSAALVLLGGWHWSGTWVLVILYFTCVHSALVVFGSIGLARAMAGQPYRYPLIGPKT